MTNVKEQLQKLAETLSEIKRRFSAGTGRSSSRSNRIVYRVDDDIHIRQWMSDPYQPDSWSWPRGTE